MSYEDIMYAAAILEKVARETKNTRKVIAEYVGISNINHLAEYADVNHCLSMEQVAAEIIEDNNIIEGNFDDVSTCEYTVPSVIDIGKVYARLVEDTETDTAKYPQALYNILTSDIAEKISDFNASWFYASRSELAYEYQNSLKQGV